jgi:Fic family protein
MNEFVEWVRALPDSGIDPYIANALVHLFFVAIHPFADGNGRVARVLCSLLMMQAGHKAQAFYSLEEYFGVNWEAYGRQIEAALGPRWRPEAVDATKWVEWYLNAIAEQVTRAERRIARLVAEIGVAAALMIADGHKPNPGDLVALWLVRKDDQVTNRTYRNATGVTSKTALKHLQRLRAAGYLSQVGERRGARYVLGEKAQRWESFDRLVDLWVDRGPDEMLRTVFGDPKITQEEQLFTP